MLQKHCTLGAMRARYAMLQRKVPPSLRVSMLSRGVPELRQPEASVRPRRLSHAGAACAILSAFQDVAELSFLLPVHEELLAWDTKEKIRRPLTPIPVNL